MIERKKREEEAAPKHKGTQTDSNLFDKLDGDHLTFSMNWGGHNEAQCEVNSPVFVLKTEGDKDESYLRQNGLGQLASGFNPEGLKGDSEFQAVCGVSEAVFKLVKMYTTCLLYTSPSPRDGATSRMPSSA